MTDIELLNKVKAGLGISGNYQDDVLQVHIDNVKAFMSDAGVPATVINSEISVGCILIGVNDLWNYSSGGVKFSEFFNKRLIQLTLHTSSEDGGSGGSYNELTDLPTLNGTTIQGDLESDDVGIDIVESTDILDMF